MAVANVYIVSPDADDWGANLLDGDPIEPGARLTLKVNKGVLDFKPTNDSDETLGALYGLELDEGTELVVTGIVGLPKGAKIAFRRKVRQAAQGCVDPAKTDDTETKITDGEYCMAVNRAGWSIWDVTKTTFSKNFSAEVGCSLLKGPQEWAVFPGLWHRQQQSLLDEFDARNANDCGV